jgi:hypothetical protein
VLTNFAPTGVTAGVAGLSLTATGSELTATSAVRWNGGARPATFVSITVSCSRTAPSFAVAPSGN